MGGFRRRDPAGPDHPFRNHKWLAIGFLRNIGMGLSRGNRTQLLLEGVRTALCEIC